MKRDDISVFKGLSIEQSQIVAQIHNLYKVNRQSSMYQTFGTKWKRTLFDRITYYGKASVVDDKKLFLIQSKDINAFFTLLSFIRRYDSRFCHKDISNSVCDTAAEMRDEINWRVYV